jgi:predicted PurR-regulated permease PerM
LKRENLYWRVGVTVFLTVAAILLFYDILFGRRVLLSLLDALAGSLKPVAYGALIAYLLAPVIDFWERLLFREQVSQAQRARKLCARGPRAVSLLLTWIMIGVAVWVLLSVLLPDVYLSIHQLIGNVETYYNTVRGWIERLLEANPEVETWATAQMNTYYTEMTDWLTKSALPQAQTLMTVVSGGVFQVLKFLSNLLVGIIVSLYLLATKERCAAHCRKLVCGFLSPENGQWLFRGVRRADIIFSGFVRGKLLDSLIIGVLCFIGCRLLSIPYTPLVSVIVGVTNIIPFFGPFLGAIPSILLILLAEPIKAVYFLLFVIFLQQLDGNIIGPKLLGDRTGLSSLWVIIAILVGGGFFGVPGMFFGVPVCACLYAFVSFLTRTRLRRRGLPEDTAAYCTDMPRPEPEKKNGT